MSTAEPSVSVIIPTRDRPGTVIRAVKSALEQTLREIEVIVVFDGEDAVGAKAVMSLADPRLIVITLPVPQGCSVARNTGIGSARGKWIAFLDDDDYWLPRKLEIQLRAAADSPCRYPIIATRLIARSEKGDYHWPRRILRADENLSEYLLCRKTPFGGEGLVLPSTILTPRELAVAVPFTPGLMIHNDYDWLLRASRREGARVLFVGTEEPLAVWHIEENRPRLSNNTNWQYALSWIRNNRELVTPRAYASFVLTEVVMRAAAARDWRAFVPLLKDACKNGSPSWNDLISYLGIWLIPRKIASRLALVFDRWRRHQRRAANAENHLKIK